MKRIILTTGGTGGHIFPALATAEELRRRYPDIAILFLGSATGPEADLAARAGLEFASLPVRGVLGKGLRAIGALLGMARGIVRAGAILRRVRPETVLGFGGYAAFSGLAAARLQGIPTAVHEQNSIPGLANRVCAKFARRIFLSLPDERAFFAPERTRLTGNPVRASIAALSETPPKTREAFGRRVLVMGGSQGAKAINEAVLVNLPALLEANVVLWHQTGASDYERVRDAYRKAGAEGVRVEAFIQDMAEAYAWADLALCRSGATTVAELACAALPALFIPFPHATHDHQMHNAGQLVAAGMAEVLDQMELTGCHGDMNLLVRALTTLLDAPERLESMSAAARGLARPKAAAHLVDELEKLVGKNKSDEAIQE